MKTKRIGLIAIILVVSLLVFTGCTKEQGTVHPEKPEDIGEVTNNNSNGDKEVKFPKKPIRVIIPYAAGGNSDLNARKLAEIIETKELLPEPLIVTNIQGGGTMEGLNAVNEADPDGYTIMLHHTAMLSQANMGTIEYTYNDFEPICQVLEQASLIVARAEAPYNNLDELLEYAEEHPGELVWTYSGIGGNSHLISEVFWTETGSKDLFIEIVHQGGADALSAQLGGHADIRASTVIDALRYVESGDLKVLAISGTQRLSELPDVLTYEELGFKQNTVLKQGIWATKGTPKYAIDILEEAILTACDTDEYRDFLTQVGAFEAMNGAEEWQDILDNDNTMISEIIFGLGIGVN